MEKLYEALKALAPGRVLEREAMARHTTYRIGGPAELMFFPASVEETIAAVRLARAEDVPVFIVGRGSNLLVGDGGLKGLCIVFGEDYSGIDIEGDVMTAQAGASLAACAAAALRAGLTGFEPLSGIPGSVGGGCAMNCGAYGGQIGDVLESAEILFGDRVETLSRDDMAMGYRTSRPLREGGIVLTARFRLKPGDSELIAATMRDLNARRRDKQPLDMPSAGSVFKRPEGHFAGALIEQCGLKGCAVGGAQVSEKHAGFIVNTGGATAKDVSALIGHIQDVVLRETGVCLEPEQRIIGEP